MNPRDELNALYLEWHELSEAEHEAIRGFDWDRLALHQRKKEGLQRRIQAIEQGLGGTAGDAVQGPFQTVLHELVRMEAENHRLLEACLATARRERDGLRQSSQNLRRLHQAYVPDAACVWQSYS